jgi:hypothetical protein
MTFPSQEPRVAWLACAPSNARSRINQPRVQILIEAGVGAASVQWQQRRSRVVVAVDVRKGGHIIPLAVKLVLLAFSLRGILPSHERTRRTVHPHSSTAGLFPEPHG